MNRYCLIRPEIGNDCWEVMPNNQETVLLFKQQTGENKPKSFIYGGDEYESSDYSIRRMSLREVKKVAHLTSEKITTERRDNQYNEWLSENDKCELLRVKEFYLSGKKYYTVNRKEFKSLLTTEKDKGNFSFRYREQLFSVYHFC